MTDPKKDELDHLIDFMLSDDSPIGPEDQDDLARFDRAMAAAEARLARRRLERAKAGVASDRRVGTSPVNIELGRRILAQARSGDHSVQVTLAARFGDGSMKGDLDAIAEDLAELDADSHDKD